jgi:site-specific DNA recombinase
MIAAVAQWEREEIVSRVAASIPIRAKLGKSLGGHPSLGYKWEGKDFMIDEKYAPVRKLVYELFLEHKRKKTVARLLNEKGYRTQNGNKFTDTTIVRLLRDPTAKGHRRANYTKRVNDGKHWELKPTSEWIILPCPALVSEELWDACNKLLDESEKERKNVGPKPKHLLAGLVHCETCSGKMYVFHDSKSPTYTCKKCKTRIPTADLEEIFHEQLKTFLLTNTTIAEYLEKIDSSLQEKQQLLGHVMEERQTIQKEMKGMIAMRANNELTKEFFAEHYKPLEERMIQINDQLPELEAEIDFLRIQNHSTDVVLQDAQDLYSQWGLLSYEDKRNIIEIITARITIGKEDIHIKLSYLPAHPPKKQTQSPPFQQIPEKVNATR